MYMKIFGCSVVHGKVFLVTIISKNLLTLKAANGQTVKHIDYACKNWDLTKEGIQRRWNCHCSIMHNYLAVHINARKRLILRDFSSVKPFLCIIGSWLFRLKLIKLKIQIFNFVNLLNY